MKNLATSSGIAAPKNESRMLSNIFVTSSGYKPINPNGMDMQNDNGIDKIPSVNAFNNSVVGSGEFLSFL
jgi:hypothetical protein